MCFKSDFTYVSMRRTIPNMSVSLSTQIYASRVTLHLPPYTPLSAWQACPNSVINAAHSRACWQLIMAGNIINSPNDCLICFSHIAASAALLLLLTFALCPVWPVCALFPTAIAQHRAMLLSIAKQQRQLVVNNYVQHGVVCVCVCSIVFSLCHTHTLVHTQLQHHFRFRFRLPEIHAMHSMSAAIPCAQTQYGKE